MRQPSPVSGKVKTARAGQPKQGIAPKAPRRRASTANAPETKVARLTRELGEALEQQNATGDILEVIASSPDDAQPVFDAIARNANRLVGGTATTVVLRRNDMLHLAAFTTTDQASIAFFER